MAYSYTDRQMNFTYTFQTNELTVKWTLLTLSDNWTSLALTDKWTLHTLVDIQTNELHLHLQTNELHWHFFKQMNFTCTYRQMNFIYTCGHMDRWTSLTDKWTSLTLFQTNELHLHLQTNEHHLHLWTHRQRNFTYTYGQMNLTYPYGPLSAWLAGTICCSNCWLGLTTWRRWRCWNWRWTPQRPRSTILVPCCQTSESSNSLGAPFPASGQESADLTNFFVFISSSSSSSSSTSSSSFFEWGGGGGCIIRCLNLEFFYGHGKSGWFPPEENQLLQRCHHVLTWSKLYITFNRDEEKNPVPNKALWFLWTLSILFTYWRKGKKKVQNQYKKEQKQQQKQHKIT